VTLRGPPGLDRLPDGWRRGTRFEQMYGGGLLARGSCSTQGLDFVLLATKRSSSPCDA